MKRIILAVAGFAVLIGIGIYAGRSHAPTVSASGTSAEAIAEPAHDSERSNVVVENKPQPRIERTPAITQTVAPTPVETVASSPSPDVMATGPSDKLMLDQMVAMLVSPLVSFSEKQKAWARLRDSGKLDSAITELEQRVAADPQSAETVSALGQAYYKKAGGTKDVRESAIYAMKADQTLEAALNLDPSNWDARYVRAVGMTYWPPELNKTKDVIEQFNTLMQQQESQPPQSKFAKTYLKLGEEYEKAGYPQYAADVWKRGAALFPANDDLKEKLSGAH